MPIRGAPQTNANHLPQIMRTTNTTTTTSVIIILTDKGTDCNLII